MKQLLIFYHSQTGNNERLAQAAHDGACALNQTLEIDERIRIVFKMARDVTLDDLVQSEAWLIATPENFGYMAGEVKAVFDRSYNQIREQTAGRSYGLMISCDNDGRGAVSAIARNMVGYGMRLAQPELIVRGSAVADEDAQRAYELGQYMAGAVALGL